MELENGARGFIGTSQYVGPTEHFRPLSMFHIQGSDGWLRISGKRARFVSSDGEVLDVEPEWSEELSSAADAVRRFITEEQGVPSDSALSESNSLVEHAWHFVRWIRGDVERYPLADADDALRALRLGLSTVMSADAGARIDVDYQAAHLHGGAAAMDTV